MEAIGTPNEIHQVCDDIREWLISKNEQYGDSALDPVRIFSKASPSEQIRVRIDDKISRLVRGDDRIEADEDIVDDMIGYLILYKVVKRREQEQQHDEEISLGDQYATGFPRYK